MVGGGGGSAGGRPRLRHVDARAACSSPVPALRRTLAALCSRRPGKWRAFLRLRLPSCFPPLSALGAAIPSGLPASPAWLAPGSFGLRPPSLSTSRFSRGFGELAEPSAAWGAGGGAPSWPSPAAQSSPAPGGRLRAWEPDAQCPHRLPAARDRPGICSVAPHVCPPPSFPASFSE